MTSVPVPFAAYVPVRSGICAVIRAAVFFYVRVCFWFLAFMQVRVSHEDRDVWMLFLEKALTGEEGHFDSAAQYCKNATERAQVKSNYVG